MIPLAILAKSYRYFPQESATIRITRRPWWTGWIISSAYAKEWCDAWRDR